MCGDFESDELQAEEFYDRFVEHTRLFLAGLPALRAEEEDPLFAHLNSLFRQSLSTAAEHDSAPAGVSGYERLSMEPLVFARLAGFIAAHQPLEDDPLRRLIEALMAGYAEGEDVMPERGQHHYHSHDHTH